MAHSWGQGWADTAGAVDGVTLVMGGVTPGDTAAGGGHAGVTAVGGKKKGTLPL